MNCRVVLLLILFIGAFIQPCIPQSKKNTESKKMSNQFGSDNFPLMTPSKWSPGDIFIYADSTLNITITSDSLIDRNELYLGKEFKFINFIEKTDWLGKSSMYLVFENNDKIYYYNTKKNLSEISDTLYNPLIPSFISKSELSKANELLKNKDIYILTPEWLGNDNRISTYKYVQVKIDSVTVGNNQNPYKIYFTYKGNQFFIYSNLSNTLYGTSRYLFDKIFSFEDPKNKYKDIDDETWDAIIASKIMKGMTHNEVRLSIGKPTEIKRIPTYSGLREIWSYGSGLRIVFFDGRVEQ